MNKLIREHVFAPKTSCLLPVISLAPSEKEDKTGAQAVPGEPAVAGAHYSRRRRPHVPMLADIV